MIFTVCSSIVLPSTEVVHRPRLQFPLQIDTKNLYEIRMIKQFPSTQRLHSRHLKARSTAGDATETGWRNAFIRD